MPKTATVRARIEPALKAEVEQILKKLGFTASEVINVFYHHIAMEQGLPFEVKIPNATTLKTFEETDARVDWNICKDTDDFFKQLEI